MGLLKAIGNALGSTMADQWREYFYCDSLPANVLVTKGQKRTSTTRNSSNVKGEDNIISNGSVIAVNEGQCMIIVDQGQVVDLCAEAGEFIYDTSTEPSLFYGSLGKNILNTFKTIGKRFTFGGDPGKDQRVYFFNTKEIMDNKYGTASPVPFRVVDHNIGLDVDISVKCNGSYSYHIIDPLLFYTNVCGNIPADYTRDKIDAQLKSEILTALQPAFAAISEMGVRYSAVPAHAMELGDKLNEILSDKWSKKRGIEIVEFGVNTITASEEDQAMIKEAQRQKMYTDKSMLAANIGLAQAEAMKAAASNTATGPMMAFAGMNMATMTGGMNINTLMEQDAAEKAQAAAVAQAQAQAAAAQAQAQAQAQAAAAPAADGWTCSCGHTGNTGKFCAECGAPKPVAADGWTCSCGAVNKGKFCAECGAKKPVGEPLYKCDKCGWEPEDPKNPPKFCPECGDPFNDADIQ